MMTAVGILGGSWLFLALGYYAVMADSPHRDVRQSLLALRGESRGDPRSLPRIFRSGVLEAIAFASSMSLVSLAVLDGWWVKIGALVGALMAWRVSAVARWVRLEELRKVRDHCAEVLLTPSFQPEQPPAVAGKSAPFAVDVEKAAHSNYELFLRPFATQRELEFHWTESDGKGQDFVRSVHLETLIREVRSDEATVVGIGRSETESPAGAIHPSDAEWWREFQKAATHARGFFIVPGAQGGSLEEIRWLTEQHRLRDCTWIMPRWTSSWKVEAQWKRNQTALAELGIRLPEFQALGGFFLVDPVKGASRVLPMDPGQPGNPARQLRRLQAIRDFWEAPNDSGAAPSPLKPLRLWGSPGQLVVGCLFSLMGLGAFALLFGSEFSWKHLGISLGFLAIGAASIWATVLWVELGSQVRVRKLFGTRTVSWTYVIDAYPSRGGLTLVVPDDPLESEIELRADSRKVEAVRLLSRSCGRSDLMVKK